MAKIEKLADESLRRAGVPEESARHIDGIRVELESAYRDRFNEMTAALKRQASAIDRMSNTLDLLLTHVAPELKGKLPALRLAEPGEAADVATIVADPIGAGYSYSQQDIANALNCSASDVSVLLKGLKVRDDPQLALAVRRGRSPSQTVVNYHSRTIDRLLEALAQPAGSLPKEVRDAHRRILRRRGPDSTG